MIVDTLIGVGIILGCGLLLMFMVAAFDWFVLTCAFAFLIAWGYIIGNAVTG